MSSSFDTPLRRYLRSIKGDRFSDIFEEFQRICLQVDALKGKFSKQANQKIVELMQKARNLQSEYKNIKKTNVELNDYVKSRLDSIESHYKKHFERQLDEVKSHYDEEHEQLAAELKKTKKQLKFRAETLLQLRQQIKQDAVTLKQIKTIQKEMQEKDEQYEKMVNQVKEYQGLNSQLQRDNSRLKDHVFELESAATQSEEEKVALAESNAQLESLVTELNETVKQGAEESIALSESKEDLEELVSKLQTTVAQYDEEVRKVAEKMAASQAETKEYKEKLKSVDQTLKNFTNQKIFDPNKEFQDALEGGEIKFKSPDGTTTFATPEEIQTFVNKLDKSIGDVDFAQD